VTARVTHRGERLGTLVAERERVLSTFVDAEQERIARACHDMARRFARGGVLIPFGTDAAATDAAHVAVEFMHPVIVGKRALPALAPTNDPTGASTPSRLVRPDDIALGLDHGVGDPAVGAFLAEARRAGLLTISMSGDLPAADDVDHGFAVPSSDPQVVQEVQETTYHVLWELVHVFFEHPGLLNEACITCGDVAVAARVVAVRDGTATIERDGATEDVAVDLVTGVEVGDVLLCHAGVALEKAPSGDAVDEPAAPAHDDLSGFLYPFLGGREKDLDAVLADVRASTVRKAADVIALRREIDVEAIEGCAAAVRERLERGGRLIAFGNGGSSTDAQDAAADLLARGWPAVALNNDVATVTAVGNDVGYDNVFARQIIPLGRADDVALAISTSGSSPNVLVALEEAHRRGMLTVGITGYDGGRLGELPWLDHLFVARSDYIPRLQEAHATMYHLLIEAIGERS
jgi:D-sedoheptulose 7-phosphate isomerase